MLHIKKLVKKVPGVNDQKVENSLESESFRNVLSTQAICTIMKKM
uniref:Transposase n=1 Tax=Strongyloides papillosus TaxID=174720 RepID=A0A0N5CIY0_STREA